jgi:hypothetical protein
MSDNVLSPDGAWRWDGARWVPNQRPSSHSAAAPQQTSTGASRDPMLVPALVASVLALLPLLVHLIGDTIRAFAGQAPTGQPWYLETWFIVLQFLLGAIALTLASLAVLRDPSRLAAIVMAIAGGAFLQGMVVLFYRVVVSHFGYDVPF